MTDESKILAVNSIRASVKAWTAEHRPNFNEHNGCFYYSVLGAKYLKSIGIDALVQAGSLSWPRINIATEDDGVIATHFSYMWEPDSTRTISQIAQSLMPEMHVWIYLPKTKEIVDVTTRSLKKQCEDLTGMKWSAPEPPDFLWCGVRQVPKDVHYESYRSANQLVAAMICATKGLI